MTAVLAKRKCGCERCCCNLCGATTKMWLRRCYRHEARSFTMSLVASSVWTCCDRCARKPRVGPVTTIPAGTKITLSDGREVTLSKPATMGPVNGVVA